MTLMDPISDALTNMKNSENATKEFFSFRPASRLLGEILKIMKTQGYIKEFELIDDRREGTFKIILCGKINECKAIKPRYAVKKNDFEKFEKRYLPAKNVGIIIVSTPEGVITHTEAKNRGLGGRLLAYIY